MTLHDELKEHGAENRDRIATIEHNLESLVLRVARLEGIDVPGDMVVEVEEQTADTCDLTRAEFEGRAHHTREYRGGELPENITNTN